MLGPSTRARLNSKLGQSRMLARLVTALQLRLQQLIGEGRGAAPQIRVDGQLRELGREDTAAEATGPRCK